MKLKTREFLLFLLMLQNLRLIRSQSVKVSLSACCAFHYVYRLGMASLLGSLASERGLVSISDVEEAVGVFALLVDLAHQVLSFQDVPSINEEVERVLLGKSDSLADDESELVSGEVARGQVPEHERGSISVNA